MFEAYNVLDANIGIFAGLANSDLRSGPECDSEFAYEVCSQSDCDSEFEFVSESESESEVCIQGVCTRSAAGACCS